MRKALPEPRWEDADQRLTHALFFSPDLQGEGPSTESDTMHIGLLIKTYFDALPRTYTVSRLATQLNCNRRNIYDIFSRPTLDVELLWRISKALDHNFFEDLSRMYAEASPSGEEICHR